MPKITREKFKTMHNVFDEFTNRNLYKLIRQGYFEGLVGQISLGKESNVFSARTKDKELIAIKIHRLETSDFNQIYEYLHYDPRYANIKKNRRHLIFAWAQREFRNLIKAREAGVKVPKPIGFCDNIVLEEFIGTDEPAPRIKDNIPTSQPKTKAFLNKIIDNIRKLYLAGLIHTDLSAFNILNNNGTPVLIDFSQCTTTDNPNAMEYLRRDVNNILTFFAKYGVALDLEDTLEKITKPKKTKSK